MIPFGCSPKNRLSLFLITLIDYIWIALLTTYYLSYSNKDEGGVVYEAPFDMVSPLSNVRVVEADFLSC
jgi:hypothetical protein